MTPTAIPQVSEQFQPLGVAAYDAIGRRFVFRRDHRVDVEVDRDDVKLTLDILGVATFFDRLAPDQRDVLAQIIGLNWNVEQQDSAAHEAVGC